MASTSFSIFGAKTTGAAGTGATGRAAPDAVTPGAATPDAATLDAGCGVGRPSCLRQAWSGASAINPAITEAMTAHFSGINLGLADLLTRPNRGDRTIGDWTRGAVFPWVISYLAGLTEWVAAVKATEGIVYVGLRQGRNPFTGETIRIDSPGLARMVTGERATASLHSGRVTLDDSPEHRAIAGQLAQKLGAHVLKADG